MSTTLRLYRLASSHVRVRAPSSIRPSSSSGTSSPEASNAPSRSSSERSENPVDSKNEFTPPPPDSHVTSISARDAELQAKFRERLGGMETEAFEDGKPVEGLRRNVKSNMFRLI